MLREVFNVSSEKAVEFTGICVRDGSVLGILRHRRGWIFESMFQKGWLSLPSPLR